jgi:hypothetical protein
MGNSERKNDTRQKKSLSHAKGITCFDKKTERAFFFILTVIMLIWGILVKLGVL